MNAGDGRSGSVLQVALAKGHNEIVQLLLENRAGVNAQDEGNDSPLQVASAISYEAAT